MGVIIDIGKIQEIESRMLDELNQICKRNGINYSLAYGSVLGAVRHHGPIPWDSDADVLIPLSELDNLIKCLQEELSHRFKVYFYKNRLDYDRPFPRIGLRNTHPEVIHVDLFISMALPHDRVLWKYHIFKTRFLNETFRLRHKRMEEIKTWHRRLAAPFVKRALNIVPRTNHIEYIERHRGKYSYENCQYVTNSLRGKYIYPKSMFDNLVWVDYGNLKLPIPRDYDSYLKHIYGNYTDPPPVHEQARLLAKTAVISKSDYQEFWPNEIHCVKTI